MSAVVRLALAVALVWLRPLHSARTIREQREDIRILVNVTSDLAAAVNARRGRRHLYAVK